MVADRDRILSCLRSAARLGPDLPEIEGSWLAYDDRTSQFAAAVGAAGGHAEVLSRAELGGFLESHRATLGADSVRCEIPGVVDWPETAVSCPADYAEVDLLVAGGELAVAENGAVWVDGAALAERAGLFLAQHLVLVVGREALLDTMHQAYERLPVDSLGSYGVFVSGPSKTADIEQCLVIGAHGPRSLTVALV